MPFVKLDTGILNSTLWIERECREIFITSLLMAEPKEVLSPTETLETSTLNTTGFVVPPGWYGFVAAASVGIIRRALVDSEAGIQALNKLASPDPESRSKDFEGRRMVRVDGGYIVLNYMKYRDRDYTGAERQRNLRARKSARSKVHHFAIQWKAIEAFYRGLCAYCEVKPWTDIDLMLPEAQGGVYEPRNVIPACRTCLTSKGAQIWNPKKSNPFAEVVTRNDTIVTSNGRKKPNGSVNGHGDHRNEAINHVMNECSFTNEALKPILFSVLDQHKKKNDIPAYEVAAAMIQAWREYLAIAGTMKYHWEPENFFSKGHWLTPQKWPMDSKKIEEIRMRKQASVGTNLT